MRNKIYISYLLFVIILFMSLFFVSSCNKNDSAGVDRNDVNIAQTVKNEDQAKLALGAKMIYMKYFTESCSYSVTYDTINDSMAGKGISELQDEFMDWNIIYLDEEKIILEQKIESYGPQTYIISTTKTDEDEFVCVYSFDELGERSLYSVFDTPVMLFDDATIKELRDGIMVIGQDALYNALEDFGE